MSSSSSSSLLSGVVVFYLLSSPFCLFGGLYGPFIDAVMLVEVVGVAWVLWVIDGAVDDWLGGGRVDLVKPNVNSDACCKLLVIVVLVCFALALLLLLSLLFLILFALLD